MHTILVIVAAALVAAPVSSGTAPTPSLRVTVAAPLAVSGAHFGSREQVRLILRADGVRRVRLLRASTTGSFRSVYAGVAVRDPCSLTATATGGAGSKAIWRLSERMCPLP